MTRLAIVTGGTRGIGAAISKRLKADGFQVAATFARNDNIAHHFAEESAVEVFKWDVSSLEACQKGVEEVVKKFGCAPSVLVNNAGITHDGMLHKMAEDDWHSVIHTNLDSCFNMCRAVLPLMREEGYGRIVNISSINAQSGQFGQTNYAAAKAGILGFTKSLARESALKGITVNVVAPGYIKTDMTDAVPAGVMEAIVQQIPVRRLGKPEEVARAVAFLAAEESGFITGETLAINGGHYMA